MAAGTRIEEDTLAAFRRAATLAPDNLDYAFRYGEAFDDLEEPRWEEALAWWRGLRARLRLPATVQLAAVHEARVLVRLERPEEARTALEVVQLESLQGAVAQILAEADALRAGEAAP